MYNNMVLPKLWLSVIQKYWEKKMPKYFPKSSSKFSLKFDSDEISEAVKIMEDKLNTEDSIITEDMFSEGQKIGNYLGTYNVTGEAGELTLLSPERVSNKDIDVLAFHYTENKWEKIEDAKIDNGFVYGTLNSFSPIAIFTVRRDTVFDESGEVFGHPTYIANGIPITVTKNEDGEIIVKDANGKMTTVTEDTVIVGGSTDGTDVDTTSVFVKGVKIRSIKAGSHSKDKVVNVGLINCTVIDSEIERGITGGSCNCRVKIGKFDIKNTKASFFGVGESYWSEQKIDCNTMSGIGLGSNAWIKYGSVNIENSNIDIVYAGGNSGYLFCNSVIMNIDGGKYLYITTGGSNGKTLESTVNIKNADVNVFQTINRGIVGIGTANIINCNIDKLFTFGDSTDSTVNGHIDTVHMYVTGGNAKLFVGINDGKEQDIIHAKNNICSLIVSRSANVKYADKETESILKDIIRIK